MFSFVVVGLVVVFGRGALPYQLRFIPHRVSHRRAAFAVAPPAADLCCHAGCSSVRARVLSDRPSLGALVVGTVSLHWLPFRRSPPRDADNRTGRHVEQGPLFRSPWGFFVFGALSLTHAAARSSRCGHAIACPSQLVRSCEATMEDAQPAQDNPQMIDRIVASWLQHRGFSKAEKTLRTEAKLQSLSEYGASSDLLNSHSIQNLILFHESVDDVGARYTEVKRCCVCIYA